MGAADLNVPTGKAMVLMEQEHRWSNYDSAAVIK